MAAKKKAGKKGAKKPVAKKKSVPKKVTRRRPAKAMAHTILESEVAGAGVAILDARKEPAFTKTQWTVLAILSFIQFMHIVDFMVLMPLNKKFEEFFHISTNQFGWLVSSYTLAAFAAGIAGSFFVERISRKRSLLIGFGGFVIGNLLCAVAPSFHTFLLARILTGAFGGLISGISFAVIGDIIEPAKRGRATGIMMTAFSVAAVAGVPAGIWLANHFFLQMPYFMIAGGSALVYVIAQLKLPSLTNHLFGPKTNVMRQILAVFAESKHRRLYLLMIFHFMAGFSIIPYIAGFMQKNNGLSDAQLPFVYFLGGIATIISLPAAGWLTDKFGTVRMYTIISVLATLPFILVTNEFTRNSSALILFSTLFFIFVSGRMVPVMALVNNTVNPSVRGTFMSLNGSVQQLAMSMGAIIASFIIIAPPGRPMQYYMYVGIFGCIFNFAAIVVANTFRNKKV